MDEALVHCGAGRSGGFFHAEPGTQHVSVSLNISRLYATDIGCQHVRTRTCATQRLTALRVNVDPNVMDVLDLKLL